MKNAGMDKEDIFLKTMNKKLKIILLTTILIPNVARVFPFTGLPVIA